MRRNGSGHVAHLLVEVEAVEVHRRQLLADGADVGSASGGGSRRPSGPAPAPGPGTRAPGHGQCVARPAQRRPCSPWMAIVPASARSTPVRILTSVDLPAPLAPSRAWTSPGRTARSTARRATTGPNALPTAVVCSSSGSVMINELGRDRYRSRPCGLRCEGGRLARPPELHRDGGSEGGRSPSP